MKRFRKITAVMLAAVCAALLLTACGGGGSKGTSSIDVSALADELNKDTVKNDTLTETSSDMLSSIYFFKDGQVTESKAYMSSGSTADEICVVKCRDDATTDDVEKLFQSRVQKQSDLYATYKAEESDKLKKAIIKSTGSYTVLVVCTPSWLSVMTMIKRTRFFQNTDSEPWDSESEDSEPECPAPELCIWNA